MTRRAFKNLILSEASFEHFSSSSMARTLFEVAKEVIWKERKPFKSLIGLIKLLKIAYGQKYFEIVSMHRSLIISL